MLSRRIGGDNLRSCGSDNCVKVLAVPERMVADGHVTTQPEITSCLMHIANIAAGRCEESQSSQRMVDMKERLAKRWAASGMSLEDARAEVQILDGPRVSSRHMRSSAPTRPRRRGAHDARGRRCRRRSQRGAQRAAGQGAGAQGAAAARGGGGGR
jgi:hypothetical protein